MGAYDLDSLDQDELLDPVVILAERGVEFFNLVIHGHLVLVDHLETVSIRKLLDQ